jgi:hypothetical protein
MRRTMFFAVMLSLLFGVDATANQSRIARDMVRATSGLGKNVGHVVDVAIRFMIGR